MGGKKRKTFPTVEDELAKPWCYYCERDFTDMLNLIRHQKAKHFKCERCGRRLNTAGGLSVHLNQVHKEQLHHVENSLENRKGLEVEIFGMEGIPDDIKQTHQQRVLQNFYQAEAERRQNTGNPAPGSGAPQREPRKRPTIDELKAQLQEHRIKRATSTANIMREAPMPVPSPQNQLPYSQPPAAPFSQPGVGRPPSQFGGTGFGGTPSIPALATPPNFPPRGPPNGSPAPAISVDDLIADAARNAMAEKATKEAAQAGAVDNGADKKTKKDTKISQLVYSDNSVSPEEKWAQRPKYAFVKS